MHSNRFNNAAVTKRRSTPRQCILVGQRSRLKEVTVIAPKQHRRWIVNALARRLEYREHEFRFEKHESSTEIVIECGPDAFQQIEQFHRTSIVRLVLLDSIEGIGNCRDEILA